MKTMNKVKVFILATNLVIDLCLGNEIKILRTPSRLVHPRDNIDVTNKLHTYETGDFRWKVWSDRDGNIAYKNSDGLHQKDIKIHYLKEFWVTAETGEFVNVYKDHNPVGDILSEAAINYGWIKKENLLLWELAPKIYPSAVTKKAMILSSVDVIDREDFTEKDIFFVDGPDSSYSNLDRPASLFQFYWVYKEFDDYILLGTRHKIASDVNRVILGWMHKDKVIRWNTRIALEPNWNHRAVEERKRGLPTKLVESEFLAERYANGEDIGIGDRNNIVFWTEPLPISTNRFPGEIRRFPLIDHNFNLSNPNIVAVHAIGKIYTKELEEFVEIMDAIEWGSIQKDMEETKQAKHNFNIIFIVDGTRSMENYFGSISNTIEKCKKEIDVKYANHNINYGGVIYRDHTEGIRAIEINTLGSSTGFNKFFNPNKAKDINNTTETEAVFRGIREAIVANNLFVEDNFINIFVLVGDAANHKEGQKNYNNKYNLDITAKLLSDYKIHLICFQAHYRNKDAFHDFIPQMKSLIEKADKYTFDKLKNEYPDDYDPQIPYWNEYGQYFRANHMYAINEIPLGSKLESDRMQKSIMNFIEITQNSYSSFRDTVQRIIDGKGVLSEYLSKTPEADSDDNYCFPFSNTMWLYLYETDIDLTNMILLKKKRYQFHAPALTVKNVRGQDEELWKEVLLMTTSELSRLSTLMEDISLLYHTEDRKIGLQEVWARALKKWIGESDINILDLTLEQADRMLFHSVPRSRSIMWQVRLKDIPDLDDELVNDYIQIMGSKSEILLNIIDSVNYPYEFTDHGATYFWIDSELLP